jgi:hypothetical protein
VADKALRELRLNHLEATAFNFSKKHALHPFYAPSARV